MRLKWPESFWAHIDSSGGTENCWPWSGALVRGGYGLGYSTPLGPHMMPAHRIAYLLTHPDGAVPAMVLHGCDNPLCCNPAHLFPGDQASNMADMKAKGRAAGGRTGGPWLKINDDLAQTILGERQGGASVYQLAAKHGLTPSGVRGVLKRAASGRKVRLKTAGMRGLEMEQQARVQAEHRKPYFGRVGTIIKRDVREGQAYLGLEFEGVAHTVWFYESELLMGFVSDKAG